MSSSPPPDNAPAATKETVTGPLLCFLCRDSVERGTGFQYGLIDKQGYQLYAFVHEGKCDGVLKRKLSNPDFPLDGFYFDGGAPGEEGEPAE